MNGNMNTMNQQNKQACTKWDDQRMMGDLLDTAKHLATEYGSYITEGSCPQLRQVLTNNMTEMLGDQFQIFQQMQQRGWYQTKPAQQNDIQQAKQKCTQEKSQLM